MAFTDEWTLANDVTFIARVTMAAVKSAIDVCAEDGGTPNHVKRLQLAVNILNSPGGMGGRVAVGVCTNGVITAQSSDSDIQFTVNSMWNAYAGVGL